jgi:hypothetical protein
MNYRYVISGFVDPGNIGYGQFWTETEVGERLRRGGYTVQDVGLLDEDLLSLGPFDSWVDEERGTELLVSQRIFDREIRVQDDVSAIGPLLLIRRLISTLPGVTGLVTPDKARLQLLHDELERASMRSIEDPASVNLRLVYASIEEFATDLSLRFASDPNARSLREWAHRKVQS